MRVRVVIGRYNEGWIIGKMARRLVEHLGAAGVDATLANEPDDGADVNHWMSYGMVTRRSGRVSTMFITHLDDPYQTAHVANSLREFVDVGLCMSPDMVRALTAWGIPGESLWYVLPAHDAPPEPARIRIAITTRIYDDGRKREDLLVRLAQERDLSPFHFEIGGDGWQDVVPKLRAAGASVNWNPSSADYTADYEQILESMRRCEWYLYLGLDEGSLGTLDALALGLKTIITPQGFHLDLPIHETVDAYEDVRAAFDELAAEREERIASVRNWTWAQNAADHVLVWEALLQGRKRDLAAAVHGKGRYGAAPAPVSVPGLSRRTWRGYYRRALSPARIFKALISTRRLQPLLDPLRRLRRR